MNDPTTSPEAAGPSLRTDLIDVYIFRLTDEAAPESVQFLQLKRSRPPLSGSWQPVMGHIEEGETGVKAARRELAEEVGLRAGDQHVLGFWALEQVHPYFLAEVDAVMLSPRFALQVAPSFEPSLDDEHDAFRWVERDDVGASFVWPGQRAAIREILDSLLDPRGTTRDLLRIPFD